jgi:hypothetical protein
VEKIYRELKNGEIVKGIGLPAFIHNDLYHLVTIKVYEDGIIDCWDKVDFEGFVERVLSGWVVTQVPKGSKISRFHSFYGQANGIESYIEEKEFIKEVRDTLDELQGEKTSSVRCNEAFISFLDSPDQSSRINLAKEYELIPEHLKRYVLGDMDSKDGPIKSILSGRNIEEQTIDIWRERYVGR